MGYKKLIVRDSEYSAASKEICAYLDNMTILFVDYTKALKKMADTTFKSGKVHNNILDFAGATQCLSTYATSLSGQVKSYLSAFLLEIESADSYLYDAEYDKQRDYSEKEYQKLLKCLDDPWCSFTDAFDDKLTEIHYDVFSFLNWDGMKKKMHNNKSNLLDYNNETKEGLTYLFNNVHHVDAKYENGLGLLVSSIESLNSIIDTMTELMDPNQGNFNYSRYRARLKSEFRDFASNYKTTIEVLKADIDVSIIQISDFASKSWAKFYFSNLAINYSEYIRDVGFFDAAGMVVFNMFEIAEDRVLDIVKDRSYTVEVAKSMILDCLSDITAEKSLYKDSESEKLLGDYKEILKLYEKYGKEYYKYVNTHRGENGKLLLDGRTKEAKQFNEFLDSLGDAQKILKYGEQGIEFLAEMFADYSESLSVIQSFAKNNTDTILKQAADDIESLYNKEFGAWARKFYDLVVEDGFDIAKKVIEKECKELAKKYSGEALGEVAGSAATVFAVVVGIKEGINLVGGITGLSESTKAKYESMHFYNVYKECEQAYNNALQEFLEATPEDENYEELARDLENCFNLTKKTLAEVYGKMEESAFGDESAYYRYCKNFVNARTMKEVEQKEMLTFEEFMNIVPE